MKQRFTDAQIAALSHPFGGEEETPDAACRLLMPRGCTAVVTCDVDPESMEYFGGPVWHASVCPPNRQHAEALLSGVGEGVLFDDRGFRLDVYHLRRRMTPREISRLGEIVTTTIKGVMP
ncbi:MAG: hypothetical protein ACLQDV_25300 [Candidatus Binataceae bacterium]